MADIKITRSELADPAIDEVINLEKSLARSGGAFIEDIPTPFYLNPIFYYSLAALAAGLIAWVCQEPFMQEGDKRERNEIAFISNYMYFGIVAGLLGLAVGLAHGIANRNLKKAFYCAAVGLGVGLGVSLVTAFVAGLLFGMTTLTALQIAGSDSLQPGVQFRPHGLPFFVLTCGRGLAWSIAAMGGGLSLGVALKSRKLLLNGLAGGMIGGLLGGLLFDPVHRFILDWGPTAYLSRAVGNAAVGLLVGFFIGLFENISKDAWFLMLRGPLAGKQFILFKSPMVIGSAPKSDIYLFKDPAIEPRHATVTKSGSKYLIQDEKSPSGTFVNGRKVDRCILQPDDVVSIGETVLKYHERPKG